MNKRLFEKAVNIFTEHNTIASLHHIHYMMQENPETWWAESHFGWGMSIRNMFRQTVCLDKDLPSGNWDDYYIGIVEEAVNRYYKEKK